MDVAVAGSRGGATAALWPALNGAEGPGIGGGDITQSRGGMPVVAGDLEVSDRLVSAVAASVAAMGLNFSAPRGAPINRADIHSSQHGQPNQAVPVRVGSRGKRRATQTEPHRHTTEFIAVETGRTIIEMQTVVCRAARRIGFCWPSTRAFASVIHATSLAEAIDNRKTVTELRLGHSEDVVCNNLMCAKVGQVSLARSVKGLQSL